MVVETPDSEVVPKRSRALKGEALESLRLAVKARGWNDADFAEAAELSKASVWKVLSGKSVSGETLRKVAKAIADSRPDRDLMRLLTGDIDR